MKIARLLVAGLLCVLLQATDETHDRGRHLPPGGGGSTYPAPTAIVNKAGETSRTDIVKGATCVCVKPWTGNYGAVNACDADWGDISWMQEDPDPWNQVFFVQFPAPVQIRCIHYLPLYYNAKLNVYVSSVYPFDLLDTRLLAMQGVWLDGIYNLPYTFYGTHLVFMIDLTFNTGYEWESYAIRAWSMPDLAMTGTITGANLVQYSNAGVKLTGGLTTKTMNSYAVFNQAYLDMGATIALTQIYVRWTDHNHQNPIAVSIGTTAPGSFPSSCYSTIWSADGTTDNDEWIISYTGTTRYILLCAVANGLCDPLIQLGARKIAVFNTNTCNTSTLTTTLATAYPTIAPGSSVAWPTYTITPADCFFPINFQFLDAVLGTDLVASGLFSVNWQTKTIVWNNALGCISSVRLKATFNSPTPYTNAGDILSFGCPLTCGSTVISFGSQTLSQMNHVITLAATTQTFNAATEILGTCGSFTYSILEGHNFITIDQLNNILTVQSSNNLQAGTHTATLSAKLNDYPLVTAATLTFSVVLIVYTPCQDTIINAASITSPLSYQLVFAQAGPTTITSFVMNSDTYGVSQSNPMICGVKTYSTGLPWLSVLTPADPATQNFELQVYTNDPLLTGTYTVSLVINFADTKLLQTLTQTLEVTLLHPCIVTSITTAQTIGPITFPFSTFGSPPVLTPITEFNDSVATAYGNPSLCKLKYSLELAADATKYGVSIVTGTSNQIQVATTDSSLVGTTVTLTLVANATPQQVSPGQTVAFNVIIQDACVSATLSFGSQTLTAMTSTVTQAAALQSWTAATDSLSTAKGLPEVCGPMTYSIAEGYSFVTLDVSILQITLQSTNMAHIGTQTATLQASLTNYPGIAPTKIQFSVTLVDPCLTTVLTLATTLSTFTIAAFDGVGFTQTFMPATDSAADTALVPGLCGTRVYSIVELQPKAFISFISPTGDQFVNAWSLTAFSNSLSDVGVWTVTLSVSLTNYPSIPPATKTTTATVLSPCAGTIIQPFTLADMTVSIYDMTPQVQSFTPATDSYGTLKLDLNICGAKTFVANDPKVIIAPPASGATNTDPWTISCVTNNVTLVGVYTVKVTASIVSQPTVIPLPVTFILTIVDNCKTAKLDNKGQSLPPITFVLIFATGPSLTSFNPFTDNVAAWKLNLSICGPYNYSILEAYTWASLVSPAAGFEYTDPWELAISTTSLLDIGTHALTIDVGLKNYPTATHAQLVTNVTIIHPCTLTVLQPLTLSAMTFNLSSLSPATQVFTQVADSLATQQSLPKYCGERVYTLTAYSFLTLTPPSDPWSGQFTISLSTANASNVGTYSATLQISLASYPNVIPLKIDFLVTLVQLINKLPKFATTLASSQTIQMLNRGNSQPWSFALPNAVDPDGDTVTVTADLGYAANFVVFNAPTSLEISDISEGGSNIREGLFLINFSLFDGQATVSVQFSLFVVAPVPLPVVAEPTPEPIVVQQTVTLETPTQEQIAEQKAADEAAQMMALQEYLREEFGYSFGDDPESISRTGGGSALQQQKTLIQSAFDWQTAFKKLFQEGQDKKKADASYVPVPPNPFFSNIDSQGKVEIGFNSDVFAVPNLQMINNGTIYLDDLQVKTRELAVTTTKKARTRVPVLSVEVIPGLESNATELTFRWNVTMQQARVMDIQLYFDNPLIVSQNPLPDKLKVTFNDPNMFIATNGMIMESKVIEKYLPSQQSIGASAASASMQTAASASKSVVIANFIFNLAMSASLNQLWSMINTQQLIVMMPLFKVILPGNVQAFFNQIFKIAAFDIVEVGPYINKMLRLEETQALNPNFDALGFDSMYFLNNLGTLLIGYIFYFLSILLHLFLDCFIEGNPQLAKFQMYLLDSLYYKSLLSMMMESYAIVAVCVMINLNYIKFSSFGDLFQSIVCFVALAVLIVFPLFIATYLRKAFEPGSGKILHRFQPCFDELEMKKGRKVLWHPFYFLLRRLLLAVIVVIFREMLILQIFIKAMSVVFGVILIGWVESLEGAGRRQVEFINEIIIMMVLYNMICFSPFVPDPIARYRMGYFCCFIVTLHLVVNLGIIASGSFRQLIFKYRLWRARKALSIQRGQSLYYMATYRAKRGQKARQRKQAVQTNILPLDSESEDHELRETPAERQQKAGISMNISTNKKHKIGKLTPVKEEEEDFVDEIIKEIENQNFVLDISEDSGSVWQSDWSETKLILNLASNNNNLLKVEQKQPFMKNNGYDMEFDFDDGYLKEQRRVEPDSNQIFDRRRASKETFNSRKDLTDLQSKQNHEGFEDILEYMEKKLAIDFDLEQLEDKPISRRKANHISPELSNTNRYNPSDEEEKVPNQQDVNPYGRGIVQKRHFYAPLNRREDSLMSPSLLVPSRYNPDDEEEQVPFKAPNSHLRHSHAPLNRRDQSIQIWESNESVNALDADYINSLVDGAFSSLPHQQYLGMPGSKEQQRPRQHLPQPTLKHQNQPVHRKPRLGE